MQNSKLIRIRNQLLGIWALTMIVVGYQNCARLPQFSSGESLANLASELTPQDLAATSLLTAKCASCHAPGNPNSAGFENVSNISYMTSRGYILPGNPNGSKVYQRIANQSMPPGSALPMVEQQQIYDWILGMNASGTPTPTTLPPAALTSTFTSLNNNVFKVHCTSCHGPPPAAAGGGYSMSSFANVRAKIALGNANSSDLYLRMTSTRSPMPPSQSGGLLTVDKTNAVRDWINAGAPNN